ncbi:hypothetical protein [Rhizobium sp. N122]|uniref:hypothetical protein n=1 Tax=Rhizobium sp. N122 TaxID=1764272 RepID=UPI00167EC8FA|nr:hypothetical protein [Rhizobium sp. N122]
MPTVPRRQPAHHDADILTCDADFKDFERVLHIDKKTDLDVTQVFDGGALRFYHKAGNGNLASGTPKPACTDGTEFNGENDDLSSG